MRIRVLATFIGPVFWLGSLWTGCCSEDDTSVCGNNIAEEGEACDGIDLRGETCENQGYDGGALACLDDCSGYDTSGCSGTQSFPTIISSGTSHACVVKKDATAWCWGYNGHGQLGHGTSLTRFEKTPVQVVELTGVARISCGFGYTCAVKKDGTAWCWGYNFYGQLGNDGSWSDANTPVEVALP